MKTKKYKILFFNNRKGSIKELNFSKGLITSIVSAVLISNFLIFNYLADDFANWKNSNQLIDHKKNNEILVEAIENSENRISNIEEKINNIVNHDNNIRGLLRLPLIHDDVRELGIGGEDDEQVIEKLDYLLPDESTTDLQTYFDRLDYLDRLSNLELLSFIEMDANSNKNKTKLRHFPAIYPIDMNKAKLTSRFGFRRDPFTRRYQKHEGDDFSAKTGTEVIATADGLVVSSRFNGSFGNYVQISHGNGYKTIYGHLSKRTVKKGDYVVRGQKIGEVGSTGKSTAPHLHYEIKHYRKRVDPKNFYFNNY